ncbi:ankyrin repeat domain-containing protein [Microbispora bryophytorum]|uniref:ankyrin repeat domain-containing protein n=1 Tax=Microbispora bryophytorum TaxID=1460882 RepID=UPI0033DD983A
MSRRTEYLAARGLDPEGIRRRLAGGGDQGYPRKLDDDLHEAAYEGVAEAIEVLVAHGADVESSGVWGTPLWSAVCRGHRDAVAALLRAHADPWRPVVAGRSAGDIALTGPLAGLFATLPGVPATDAGLLRLQAEADALVAAYDSWETYCGEGDGFAFVAGIDEDTAIRRLGLDPAGCPLADEGEYMDVGPSLGDTALWLGRPPGSAGVVVYSAISFDPAAEELWSPLSSPGPAVSIATNMIVDTTIEVWRDGAEIRYLRSLQQPEDDMLSEEWLCRFYDHSHGSPGGLARGLALATLLTGVEVTEDWLFHAPKRLVILPE